MRARPRPAGRRTRWQVVGVWAAIGVVAWNLVFSRIVRDAGRDYVYRQQLHERRRGPEVSISGVMQPAKVRAVRIASGVSAAIVAAGLGGTALALARRDRRRRRSSTSVPAAPADFR